MYLAIYTRWYSWRVFKDINVTILVHKSKTRKYVQKYHQTTNMRRKNLISNLINSKFFDDMAHRWAYNQGIYFIRTGQKK